MKIGSSAKGIGCSRGDGEDRGHSGLVEAVGEFGLGRVFEPICVAPPAFGLLVARDGV
jgi:hypothetical protein